MTRQQIEQYASLKREIDMIADQIARAENAGGYATDVVQGSTESVPFAVRNIVIKGYTTTYIPRLLRRRVQLVRKCGEVEQFVENIEDSNMRQLLTWRYIENKSLSETARRVGYSESQTKRRIKNFFEKMTQNEPK